MGMVTLQAKEAFPYAGRALAIGDTFSASQKDADLLKLIGRAIDAPPPRVRRKDLEPASPDSSDPSDAPTRKRQYRRRDLVPDP